MNETSFDTRPYGPTATLQEHISQVIDEINHQAASWTERFDRMEAKLDAALQHWSYWQGVMDAQIGEVPENGPTTEVTWV